MESSHKTISEQMDAFEQRWESMVTANGGRLRLIGRTAEQDAEMKRLREDRKHDASLCESCRAVDFEDYFDAPFSWELPDLRSMGCNVDCLLCSFLTKCIRAELEKGIGAHIQEPIRALAREILSDNGNSGNIRTPGTVEVECYVEWSNYPNKRSGLEVSLRTKKAGSNELSIALERAMSHRIQGDRWQPSDSRRRPLPSNFDMNNLRTWLDLSSDPPKKRYDLRSFPVYSLTPLMEARRFRVIDVVSGLIVTPTEPISYVTLSYVWGASTLPYIGGRTWTSVDLTAAPQSIQDAAFVVDSLELRYLWVDALCIHRSDQEDFHANISNIDAIFENSYFTVIAASGSDASAGLARLRNNSLGRHEASVTIQSAGDKEVSLYVTRPDLPTVLQRSKWSSQAWTFQECALSKRWVAFTDDEVLFSSLRFQAREIYELPFYVKSSATKETLTTMPYGKLFHRRPGQKEYYAAVEDYTMREFTYPGDRLDAFRGVLERLHGRSISPSTKMALSGLPEEDFDKALAWDFPIEVDSIFSPFWSIEKSARSRGDHRGTRRFPSWSWAGWRGTITYWPALAESKGFSGKVIKPETWVYDSGNIICDLTGEDRPLFRRMFCKIRLSSSVILHLWCKATRCHLTRTTDSGRHVDYELSIISPDTATQSTIRRGMEGLQFQSAKPDLKMQHHLIGFGLFPNTYEVKQRRRRSGFSFSPIPSQMHSPRKFYLLVQGNGVVNERLGTLMLTNLHSHMREFQDALDHCMTEKYIRLR